jgi:hypothetical protein
VREPRGQFAKIADTITGTMRRRQRDREPRVLVYDDDLRPRLIQPSDDAHPQIVEAAEQLVVLATGRDEDDARKGDTPE